MEIVLQEAISAHSLPLTILLGLIGIYWLLSLIGLMDFDALDGAIGTDSHHTDAVGEGDGHGHDQGDDHSPGFFGSLMKVLGATDAPVMFVITLFTLLLWAANLLGNIYLNAGDSGTLATGIFGGSIAVAFIMTRLLVRPLRPLMKLIRDTENRVPLVGLSGTVRSLTVTDAGGQIEVLRDGAPILLQARVAPGREPLSRGTEVLVVLEDESRPGTFLVRPLALAGESAS